MNNLQIFNFENNQVRTIEKNGKFWFVARDVCKCLSILNSRDALKRLDDDEKDVVNTDTLGGAQELTYINESGLYSLILTSRKIEAKKFKRWITHEVLPSIRKTGQYNTHKNPDMALNMELAMVKVAIDVLKTTEAGKIKMLSIVCKNHSISSESLPSYTEEKITESATFLLNKYNVGYSAIYFNRLMKKDGLIEIKYRPSTNTNKMKEYKSLTVEGLNYGKNLINPKNEKETQPHYFSDRFMDLINRLNK